MHLFAFFSNVFTGGDGIIILIIVLVIFGPKKLPELARGMGQAIKEFHKAKDEIQRELTTTTPTDVTVQPAPGQQPRQPAVLPPAAPAPVAAAAAAQTAAAQTAEAARPAESGLFDVGDAFQRPNPAARPVEDTHPAGQA